MGGISGSWWQTAAIILSMVLTMTTGALSVQRTHNDMMTRILVIEIEIEAMRYRLSDDGWSRDEHQKWVDKLRKLAKHDIPDVSTDNGNGS